MTETANEIVCAGLDRCAHLLAQALQESDPLRRLGTVAAVESELRDVRPLLVLAAQGQAKREENSE